VRAELVVPTWDLRNQNEDRGSLLQFHRSFDTVADFDPITRRFKHSPAEQSRIE